MKFADASQNPSLESLEAIHILSTSEVWIPGSSCMTAHLSKEKGVREAIAVKLNRKAQP